MRLDPNEKKKLKLGKSATKPTPVHTKSEDGRVSKVSEGELQKVKSNKNERCHIKREVRNIYDAVKKVTVAEKGTYARRREYTITG